jgi:hypothetical protein
MGMNELQEKIFWLRVVGYILCSLFPLNEFCGS